jgi:hypothetical protein
LLARPLLGIKLRLVASLVPMWQAERWRLGATAYPHYQLHHPGDHAHCVLLSRL